MAFLFAIHGRSWRAQPERIVTLLLRPATSLLLGPVQCSNELSIPRIAKTSVNSFRCLAALFSLVSVPLVNVNERLGRDEWDVGGGRAAVGTGGAPPVSAKVYSNLEYMLCEAVLALNRKGQLALACHELGLEDRDLDEAACQNAWSDVWCWQRRP